MSDDARPGGADTAAGYRRYAEVYDATGQTWFAERMVGLTIRLLRRHRAPVRRVVDLACGTGAAAVRLAQLGFEVTGIDLSEAMLRRARARARQAGVAVRFLVQDMRAFRAPERADLVACMYDSINHLLELDDVRATFRAVRDALRPGGLFVFDANTIYGLARRWGTATAIEHDDPDLFVVHDTAYDPARQINTLTVHGFVRRGPAYERFTEVTCERGYPLPALRAALRAAGLRVRGVYNPKLGRPTARTGWVVVVAQRARSANGRAP